MSDAEKYIYAANGLADIAAALLPLELGMAPFLGSQPSTTRLNAVGIFARGFLIHGFIRIIFGLTLKNKLARKILIISYLCEAFEAQAIIRQGDILESPFGLLAFIGGPLLMIGYTAYREATVDEKKQS